MNIVCGKCSYWKNGTRVEKTHPSIAAVKACYMKEMKKKKKVVPPAK